MLAVVVASIGFAWPWLVPLVAAGVTATVFLASHLGYLEAHRRPPLVSPWVIVLAGGIAAVSLGQSAVFATLYALLPMVSGPRLVHRLPAALLAIAMFLMSHGGWMLYEGVLFTVFLIATLLAPLIHRASHRAIDGAAAGPPRSDAAEGRRHGLSIAQESAGPGDLLTALLSLSGAQVAAIYRTTSDEELRLLSQSGDADETVAFDPTLPAFVREIVGSSASPVVWYRSEQLTPTRIAWLDGLLAPSAVALCPLRIDRLLLGCLVLVYPEALAGPRVNDESRERDGSHALVPPEISPEHARKIRDDAVAYGVIVTDLLDAQRRQRAYEAERHDFQLITSAADTLTRAQTAESSLRTIGRLLHDLTAAHAVAIYRFDAGAGTLTLQSAEAYTGTASVPRRVPAESLIHEACRRGHWLPYRQEKPLGADEVFGRAGTEFPCDSVLVLPLILENEPIGALALGAHSGGRYDDDVRSRLRLVVNYLTFAFANIWRYEDTLEEATRDALTGLLNRRSFMQGAELAQARATRSNTESSVVMLDIDHFKRVNDTWGHQAGDRVIRAFAEEVRSHTRRTDLCGRYGGEEFVLYLENTNNDGAIQLTERIRSGMAARVFDSNGEPFQVTTSAGVYTPAPGEQCSLELAIGRADEALYQAKESGRDCVISYRSPSVDPTA